MAMVEATLRRFMGWEDAHYPGGLVSGGHLVELFGDVGTELAMRHDGDEGLLATITVDFLHPVHVGDLIEATGRIVSVGNTSRTMEFEARKVGGSLHLPEQPSAAEMLAEPIVVARGTAVGVVKQDRQRLRGGGSP
jgi:3-aminobutyryl-CoA ammonia-lyase